MGLSGPQVGTFKPAGVLSSAYGIEDFRPLDGVQLAFQLAA
jgi:hypothetical protein